MKFLSSRIPAARTVSLLILFVAALASHARAQDGDLILDSGATMVSFAGPYYTTSSGTLSLAGNTLANSSGTTTISSANSAALGVLPLAGGLTATDTSVYPSVLGSSTLSGTPFNLTTITLPTSGSTLTIYGTTITFTSGSSLTSGTPLASTHPAFFANEIALGNGAYFLELPSNQPFGYYSYLSDPSYLYHFDMGYEYLMDAADGMSGVYLYDFKSQGFFYTSPGFSFPYLYDFALSSVVYYYPDPNNAGHYNTDGVRYFYVFNTGQIISK